MALPNISKLSVKDLNQLIKEAQATIQKRKREQKKALLEKFKAQAAKEGLSLDEVLGKAGAKRQKVAPKYRNPADPAQTWSGRGRKPLWVIAALKSGKKLDDLSI